MYAMLRCFGCCGCCVCDLLDDAFAWLDDACDEDDAFAWVDDVCCEEDALDADELRDADRRFLDILLPFVLCGSSPVDDRELQNLTATAARLQIPVMVETDGLRLHDPCRSRIKAEGPVGGIVARRPAQVGPAQISGNQVGPCQACLAEIRPLQVGA